MKMGEDFSDLLSQISGQSVNKQIQELAMILTRTLEIVINAVDMLEQNLNNLSNSVNQRISALEQKITMIGLNTAPLQAVKQVTHPTVASSKKSAVLNEPLEEVSAADEPTYTYSQSVQPISSPQAPPPPVPAPQTAPAPPQTAKPINPINIRQALNTELKQLFNKMRARTE